MATVKVPVTVTDVPVPDQFDEPRTDLRYNLCHAPSTLWFKKLGLSQTAIVRSKLRVCIKALRVPLRQVKLQSPNYLGWKPPRSGLCSPS